MDMVVRVLDRRPRLGGLRAACSIGRSSLVKRPIFLVTIICLSLVIVVRAMGWPTAANASGH